MTGKTDPHPGAQYLAEQAVYVCAGCGTVTRNPLKQMELYRDAGRVSCCPERNMIPVDVGALLAAEKARADAAEAERNTFKAKDASKSKLLERFRDLLLNMCDHFEDEGDRVYFGSTNDPDELREIAQQMDAWKWDSVMGQTTSDPYADLREQRARAEKAEATVASLTAKLQAAEALAKEESEARDHWFDLATYEVGGVPQHWKDRAEKAEATVASLTAERDAEKARADAAEAELEEQSQREEDAVALYERQQATIASLTEQLAEAREALEPFARWKMADGLPNGLLRTPDQHPILIGTEHLVVAGDFRRARATLSRLEKQEGEA